MSQRELKRFLRHTLITLSVLATVAAAVFVWRAQQGRRTGTGEEAAVFVRNGIRLSFELTDEHGGPAKPWSPAVATLTLTDERTGDPVRRARPRAWLSLQREADEEENGDGEDDRRCKARIRSFMGGLLSAQAEVDLNTSWLLTMNEDNTLSVLNPHVAFSRTRLRSLLSLPGRAADWVLHPDGRTVFVSIPASGHLSVVDVRRFAVRGLLPVGEGARRLWLSPDGKRLLVGREEAGKVVVLDPFRQEVLGELETEPGRLSVAFARDGRELYLASDASEQLRVFDARSLDPVAQVEAGTGIAALAHHTAAGAVFAVRRDGDLIVVDPRRHRISARLALEPGVDALAFEPSGRWLFAVSPEGGSLQAVDASTRKVRATWNELGVPAELGFSREYVYVRDASQPRLFVGRIDGLNASDDPGLSEVHLGQEGMGPRTPGDAPTLVPTPERDGMIVASASDRALLYYREGMMTAMGSVHNSGRPPRAVMVIDRALREEKPGVYRAEVELTGPGAYDVSALIDSPRTAVCLTAEVRGEDDELPLARRRIVVEPRFDTAEHLRADEEQTLTFRVRDTQLGDVPPEEVEVLAFRPPGTWQWRGGARSAAGGELAVDLPPAPAGQLRVLLGVPGRGAPLGSVPSFTLAVAPAAAPTPIPAEAHP